MYPRKICDLCHSYLTLELKYFALFLVIISLLLRRTPNTCLALNQLLICIGKDATKTLQGFLDDRKSDRTGRTANSISRR